MALICNGYRFGHMPHKIQCDMLTTMYMGKAFRDNNLTGRNRNITAGQAISSDKVGVPMGYLHPASWIMPQKAGNLSSHNNALGTVTVIGAAFWTMKGVAAGTSTCTLTGYVVAQGKGAAAGETTTSAILGGFAWCIGSADGTSTVTMQSYATGSLAGHIYVNQSEATVTQIVGGVLDAQTSDHQETGSIGKAITAAGTAGDPWIGLYANYTDPDTFGAYVQTLIKSTDIVQADVKQVNSTPIKGDGSEASPWERA